MTERHLDDFIYQVWHPGLDPKYLKVMVASGVKALIIEGYHSGTLPARAGAEFVEGGAANIVPFLKYAKGQQVPVFLTFRPFVGDPDNLKGYAPFEEGRVGYATTARIVRAGIVPLKANSQQTEEVCQKMREVLSITDNYHSIIGLMRKAFPFKVPLKTPRSPLCSKF